MAYVLLTTAQIVECAESRKDAVDLITAGGDRANLTVKGKPMTFYLPIAAIAEHRDQIDFAQIAVLES